MLLTSKTRAEAARKTGIARCTLYRWLEQEAFMELYNRYEQEYEARRIALEPLPATIPWPDAARILGARHKPYARSRTLHIATCPCCGAQMDCWGRQDGNAQLECRGKPKCVREVIASELIERGKGKK